MPLLNGAVGSRIPSPKRHRPIWEHGLNNDVIDQEIKKIKSTASQIVNVRLSMLTDEQEHSGNYDEYEKVHYGFCDCYRCSAPECLDTVLCACTYIHAQKHSQLPHAYACLQLKVQKSCPIIRLQDAVIHGKKNSC